MKVYIFDLDGTLALIDHRLHFITQKPKDFDAFHAACPDDEPNDPVVRVLHTLREQGYEIWVWTGRPATYVEETEAWLKKHNIYDYLSDLRMRMPNDYTPDHELKKLWLDSVESEEVVGVFEDRQRVVDMWRENDIVCFQVAEGDY